MSILKVARMGHPVLRAKARPVERADFKSAVFQRFIDDLIETMREYHGAGLAAPQVHESVRVFVAAIDDQTESGAPGAGNDDDRPPDPIGSANPEITLVAAAAATDWEGC